jgi:hypothetical protein
MLMTDHSLTTLARGARQTLADARNATLLVEGIGRLPDAADIVLHDMDGRPRFYCPAGSSLTTAAGAGCPAVLSVAGDTPAAGRSVVFIGHLAVVGTEHIDADRVDIVELRLTSVIVEQDDPDAPNVVTHQIPLAHYHRSTVDPLIAGAERIRRHTNGHHPDRLREFVAARTQSPAGAIVDAWIASLDASGADIAWIDVDGTHQARLPFAPPATDPADLAGRLRAQLDRPVGSTIEDQR